MFQRHKHYLEIYIQNDTADSAFLCETCFSHCVKKTRFSRILLMNPKHRLAVLYRDIA